MWVAALACAVAVSAPRYEPRAPPLPLRPYAADGENFQCRRSFSFGGSATPAEYPLPCRSAADEYSSRLAKEFVITAWWAPLVAAHDEHGALDQLQEYKQAGFNTVRTSNVAGFCQYLNVTPTPATADQVFGCLAGAISRIERAGLISIFAPGHWEVTETEGLGGATFGGNASLGGLASPHDTPRPSGAHSVSGVSPCDGPSLISVPELAWIKNQAVAHNLSIASVFLHDDAFRLAADTLAQSRWLNGHWTAAPGMTNGGTSDPVGLYRARQFVLSPEEYSVHGEPGANATQMAFSQLSMYRTNSVLVQRYRLRSWPLFALGDGGFIKDITSDSLVWLQVYGALAFGSHGLDYYCWGGAIWQMANGFGKGGPTRIYEFVKAANADALLWGNLLIKAVHQGVVSTFYGTRNDTEMPSHHQPLASDRLGPVPGPGLPVIAMDTELAVGVFSDARDSEDGYLMVVDCRVALAAGTLPGRVVSIQMDPVCKASVVPGANRSRTEVPGQEAGHGAAAAAAAAANTANTVVLRLAAGAGALLRVAGDKGCGDLLRGIQSWTLAPRLIVAQDLSAAPPEVYVHTIGGSQRRAANAAGGGAPSNSMLIGASYHEPPAGIPSALAARQLAEAGFTVVSLDSNNVNGTASALMWAAAYGFSVLGRIEASLLANRSADQRRVYTAVDRFSCHTNFGGLLLQRPTQAGPPGFEQIEALTQAMRSSMQWGVPLVAGGSNSSNSSAISVPDVVRLASRGVPLAAVAVPVGTGTASAATTPTGAAPTAAAGQQIGQRILDLYQSLQLGLRDATVAATAAISISVCTTDSDSVLRFAAFSSLWFAFRPTGFQNIGAIWWNGVGECAQVGTPKFDLIASINVRVAQARWEAAFARRDDRQARVWSTSSLNVTGSALPGSVHGGLVVSMDTELLVMEVNASVLYVLSTMLTTDPGGAPPRQVTINIRPDVNWTQAVEGNLFEGVDACDTRRVGNRILLVLPGGSGQLVAYSAGAAFPPAASTAATRRARPPGFR